MDLYTLNKLQEKLDEAIKDESNVRAFIENMKRENVEKREQFHNVDVNPETVCRPIIMNNQVTDRITYTCNKNRNTRNLLNKSIRDNEKMIKIQEIKLSSKSWNVSQIQDLVLKAKMEFDNLELDASSISSISEEIIIKKQLEEKQQENKILTLIPIKPEIVATSSLIPLGIIAILLLYSSRGKK